MNDLQPIETAPRDGTAIIAICHEEFRLVAWKNGAWFPAGTETTHWTPLFSVEGKL